MDNLQARNEGVINAPVSAVWSVITDIQLLPKIAPGVVSASGTMDQLNAVRTCEINRQGRKGTINERLVEFVPGSKAVWTVESDTMGMSKMMKDTRFSFRLERIGDAQTRVISETYYRPAGLMAKIMNGLMFKKMFVKAQEEIFNNVKTIAEKGGR